MLTKRMAAPSETELIAKAKQGDVDAFCELASSHRRTVLYTAIRFCGNASDAEDITQEVFLNAYRSIGRFRGDSSFQTWLRRILVNSFLNRRRSKGAPTTVIPEDQLAGRGAERTAFNHVMVQQVLRRLDGMTDRQRLMFIMKHQEGHTCEEIADYFGTSVGTVKKTLFRVVEQLRREFHPPENPVPENPVNERRNARLSEIP